jgi:hypothetical protein
LNRNSFSLGVAGNTRLSPGSFTYILPIIPIAIAWDGVVSHLRAYNQKELLELASGNTLDYEWKASKLPIGKIGMFITILVGIPGVKSGANIGKSGSIPSVPGFPTEMANHRMPTDRPSSAYSGALCLPSPGSDSK